MPSASNSFLHKGLHIETITNPPLEDLDRLANGIRRYNLEHLEPQALETERFAGFARAPNGELVGGVYGELRWTWLYIKMLWVDLAYRRQGLGARLLKLAEDVALQHDIHHSHLETTSFQALDFYRRRGYTIFGQLEDKPPGSVWYYLKKDLPG